MHEAQNSELMLVVCCTVIPLYSYLCIPLAPLLSACGCTQLCTSVLFDCVK